MSEATICYIGGGSKAWAKKLMGDLLCQGDVSGTLRLYDIERRQLLEIKTILKH